MACSVASFGEHVFGKQSFSGARSGEVRFGVTWFALWCGGMSFALARPVMVLRDKAKYGGVLKFSACLPK